MSLSEEDLSAAAAAGFTPEEAQRLQLYHSRENWTALHKPQLTKLKVPENLWSILYDKIYNETFDIVDSFELAYIEDEGFNLHAKSNLSACENIWLIDHCVTFGDLQTGQRLLQNSEPLVKRLWIMLDLDRVLMQEYSQLQQVDSTPSSENSNKRVSADHERVLSEVNYATDESIELVMSQAECTRGAAVDALVRHKGDVIEAINECNLHRFPNLTQTDEIALNERFERSLAMQTQFGDTKGPSVPRIPNSSDSEFSPSEQKAKEREECVLASPPVVQVIARSTPAALEEQNANTSALLYANMTHRQRCEALWPALFKLGYVGIFYTMKSRSDPNDTSAVKPEEIQTNYYINDEIGNAIVEQWTESKVNCVLAPFVCITLSNTANSIFWLTKPVEEGEACFKSKTARMPSPGPFQWQ